MAKWEQTGERLPMVLVQGFPGNQTVSKPVIDFLSDVFDIWFHNYPGFHPTSPPLAHYSLAALAADLQRRLDRLPLQRYVLAGCSAGFLLVNAVDPDARCLALMGVAPLIGSAFLRQSTLRLAATRALVASLDRYDPNAPVWRPSIFWRLAAPWARPYPRRMRETLMREVAPRALIGMARVILGLRGPVPLAKRPHILLINPQDTALDANATTRWFRQSLSEERLRVFHTTSAHHPMPLTRDYLQRHVGYATLQGMAAFAWRQADARLWLPQTYTPRALSGIPNSRRLSAAMPRGGSAGGLPGKER
jgi:hypothetical protein